LLVGRCEALPQQGVAPRTLPWQGVRSETPTAPKGGRNEVSMTDDVMLFDGVTIIHISDDDLRKIIEDARE
jgi:hypothetical protein